MLKCELVRADALEYYALLDVGNRFFDGGIHVYQWSLYVRWCVYWCHQTILRHQDEICRLQMMLM